MYHPSIEVVELPTTPRDDEGVVDDAQVVVLDDTGLEAQPLEESCDIDG